MKIQFIMVLAYCFVMCYAQLRLRGVVRKRESIQRKKDINSYKCILNGTITNDYEVLSSAVSESKYIFTARVLNIKKIRRGRKPNEKILIVYRLYLRSVMKGDVKEMRYRIFTGNERNLNGAIVYVDWVRTNNCAYKLYRHSSGLFLSDGFYKDLDPGNKPRLRLLNEPLPLSLYDLDRVNAALKGKCLLSYKVSDFVGLCAYIMMLCAFIVSSASYGHTFISSLNKTHCYVGRCYTFTVTASERRNKNTRLLFDYKLNGV